MSDVEIIARLGHACGLPWARCQATANRTDARGGPLAQCDKPSGHSGRHEFYAAVFTRTIVHRALPPTLAEWQAEWAREHPGEPGPVAEWTSADGRVWWRVGPYGTDICVGALQVSRQRFVVDTDNVIAMGAERSSDVRWHFDTESNGNGYAFGVAEDAVELGRLMQAVDGGTDG